MGLRKRQHPPLLFVLVLLIIILPLPKLWSVKPSFSVSSCIRNSPGLLAFPCMGGQRTEKESLEVFAKDNGQEMD